MEAFPYTLLYEQVELGTVLSVNEKFVIFLRLWICSLVIVMDESKTQESNVLKDTREELDVVI